MNPVNLTIVQGTPFRFLVRVQDRDAQGVLVPKSLVGYAVRLQARGSITSAITLLDLSNDNGITVDEVAGTFTINLTPLQTSELTWGRPHMMSRAIYHCEIEPPDGEVVRLLEGIITLDPEVVR